jgi:peptide/nickel transport system substrate-binding protein
MDVSRHRNTLSRRQLLKAGGVALAATTAGAWPAASPARAATPKRGGEFRFRGYTPPHFDPHLTASYTTMINLSFTHSRLLKHKAGPGVKPGTFEIEGDLAESWQQPDEKTYVFRLRKGVRWHRKPPLDGRELTAEDVRYTFDRFTTIKGNANNHMMNSLAKVEAVDSHTVKFTLKEPNAWFLDFLANPMALCIVAREAVEKFGDLKKPEAAIGTGPFTLERYDPNVKATFRRNPTYYQAGLPMVDGVDWLVMEDDAVGLAAYRTGQLDCGPWHWWAVRQVDVAGLRKSHPQLGYQDFLSPVTTGIYMRTDKPPFNDVRVRRALSHAVDRQAIIDAVFLKGEPTPAISRGASEWSPRIDQLGAGAQYYRHDPREARRLLAEAGFPQGLRTQLNVTPGYGVDLVDAFQLVQRQLKESGIEAELKLQEYGAYISSTFLGKYEGLALGPFSIAWEPHSVLYGMYMPENSRNSSHVNDGKLTGMLKEQMRIREVEARRRLIFDIQRYAAEQQYYVYLYSAGISGSWQPYVKNYAPNATFDFGSRAAALWLDRPS